MKKYGNILIENVPNESTQFLKALCTNYKPSNKPLVDQVCIYASIVLLILKLLCKKKLKEGNLLILLLLAGSFKRLYRTACR